MAVCRVGAALLALAWIALPLCADEPRVSVDLVVRNARIWTVNQKQPEAQALAVHAGRIVAVGSDVQTDAFRGSRTKVLDLAGRRVVPGCHDSHLHLLA